MASILAFHRGGTRYNIMSRSKTAPLGRRTLETTSYWPAAPSLKTVYISSHPSYPIRLTNPVDLSRVPGVTRLDACSQPNDLTAANNTFQKKTLRARKLHEGTDRLIGPDYGKKDGCTVKSWIRSRATWCLTVLLTKFWEGCLRRR